MTFVDIKFKISDTLESEKLFKERKESIEKSKYPSRKSRTI